ncbi:helix-turn-helix domain-containing protein [Streptomyces misionensis]|uniref:helix-turn-helix domain-containing protein n=1 Tax=Streptomyces misionensis TaxID=67331 RepID=UPI0033C7D690
MGEAVETGGGSPAGRMVREARQGLGLTIEELAEASGVSVRTISDVERGRSQRPQRGTLTALAQGLGLDEAARAALLAVVRAGRPAAGTPARGKTSPCTLPRGVRDFVGRHAELSALRALAQRAAEGRGPDRDVPPVAVVSGPPGSGKTTLALRLAEEFAPSFPDGEFLLDMRGLEDQPLSAQEAVLRLLGAWDVEVAQLGAEERLARYHARAARLRAVLILDNAADEAQVRPLLPREGGVLVVVTSRRTLAGLEGVCRVPLGALSEDESTALLRAIVSDGRVDAEPDAVRSVSELCGHLPLALRVAGNWAATRTNWSLRRLAGRLADEDRRLDSLSAGDLRVNSAFSLSYSRLAPAAARMFRLLSLVPGPDFGAAPAAVLTGTSLPYAEDLLDDLLDAGLLMTSPADRYRFHDLLRLYARSRLRAEEGEEGAAEAGARLRSWLLDTAVLAGRWYEPDHGAPPPDPGRLAALDDREQALRWLKAESDNWLAAFREAAARGEHARVTDVARAMNWFSDLWVSWGHWAEVFQSAARSAAALGDAGLEATHRNHLAWAHWVGGRHDEAAASAAHALRLATAGDDIAQQGWAHFYLGWLRNVAGDDAPATADLLRAKELFVRAGDIRGHLHAAIAGINLLERAGRAREAVETHREVLDALADPRNHERIPSNVRDTNVLTANYQVGFVHLGQGHWADAVGALRPIRGQFDARGFHTPGAEVHLNLAHALARLGEDDEAAAGYRAVLALDGLIPPAMVDEARAGLNALAPGGPPLEEPARLKARRP